MSLRRLRAQKRLRSHKATQEEIQALLDVARRDLSDASVQTLSTDRRFLIAYEAALTLATIPLYCSGYETYGRGHHWLTFTVLPDLMGEEFSSHAEYFDLCRTKRNIGTYDRGGEITETEAEELIEEASGFFRLVEKWLRDNYPEFM